MKIICPHCKEEIEPVNEMGQKYVSGEEYKICPKCLETLGKRL